MATGTQKNVGTGSVSTGSIAGYDRQTALEMWADSVIDSHRFPSAGERVLSLVEDVDTLFPDSEELRDMGADAVTVARALEAGLNPAAFGLAIKNGLDVRAFMDTLNAGDMSTVNEGLEHYNEHDALVELHPDPLDRAMHLHGECSCR